MAKRILRWLVVGSPVLLTGLIASASIVTFAPHSQGGKTGLWLCNAPALFYSCRKCTFIENAPFDADSSGSHPEVRRWIQDNPYSNDCVAQRAQQAAQPSFRLERVGEPPANQVQVTSVSALSAGARPLSSPVPTRAVENTGQPIVAAAPQAAPSVPALPPPIPPAETEDSDCRVIQRDMRTCDAYFNARLRRGVSCDQPARTASARTPRTQRPRR